MGGVLLMHKQIDLTGHQYGDLRVLAFIGRSKSRAAMWECLCSCGKKHVASLGSLRQGKVSSCGCKKSQLISEKRSTHGATNTDEYRIYRGVIARCENPNVKVYPDYGGRGIKICERWRSSFENFLADMGPRPSKDHSLDRENSDGHYEPGNVRWALQSKQVNNRRNTRFVTYRGEKMALTEAVRLGGGVIHYEAAWVRIKSGWSVERAVETPTTKSEAA
jgi:hypothetical protein